MSKQVCQWHDKNLNGCTNTATWSIWLKSSPKTKVVVCDDHAAKVADFHIRNGGIDRVNGAPLEETNALEVFTRLDGHL